VNYNLDFKARILKNYLTCPLIPTTTNINAFYAPEFEKKVTHSSFKKAFGLPLKVDVKFGLAVCDGLFSVNSQKKRRMCKENTYLRGPKSRLKQLYKKKGRAKQFFGYTKILKKKVFWLRKPRKPTVFRVSHKKKKKYSKLLSSLVFKKPLVRSGLQLFCADWLLQIVKSQLQLKNSSALHVLNNIIKDVTKLMRSMQGSCPILGVRLLASGRCGKKKKGMAQLIDRSVGKVPCNSVRYRIDYAQSFVTTRLGSIGLKVWICYA